LSTLTQFEQLKDEQHETVKLRILNEAVQCPICYYEFSSADGGERELHIFRECLHVFCKLCVAEVASKSIDNGQLEKVRCPATFDFGEGTKVCTTVITEGDLKMMGVSEDRVAKLARFSVTQAVDKMTDMCWCPVSDCGKPADKNEEMNWGTCTECKYRFCT
jgi:E3 ubiquitin-protein ligase RNF14